MIDINYLLCLQDLRNTLPVFATSLFSFISDVMGVGLISILLPAVFFWCINKTLGTYIFLSFSSATLFNQTLKNTVCAYRPWIRDVRVEPAATAVPGATGYSFPSGHTITGTTVYGSLAYWFRKYKWAVIPLVSLALLVGFSRNFLGVHTPQDVIVAMLESIFFLFISARLIRMLEHHPERDIWILVVGLVISILSLVYVEVKAYPMDFNDGVLLVDPELMKPDCYQASGLLSGFLIGWFIERRFIRFEIPAQISKRLIRLCFGLIGALLINIFVKSFLKTYFLPQWYKLLFAFFSYLYFTAIYPFLFTTVEKLQKKSQKQG